MKAIEREIYIRMLTDAVVHGSIAPSQVFSDCFTHFWDLYNKKRGANVSRDVALRAMHGYAKKLSDRGYLENPSRCGTGWAGRTDTGASWFVTYMLNRDKTNEVLDIINGDKELFV